MLKIFDKDHNAIGHIVKYKDCKIESEVATGDKTLSFTYLAKHHALENEMYVRTRDDEYVIKEVPATTDGFPQIVAILNLEDLQRDMWQTFSVTDTTIDAAVRTVLAGTGWTIGYCDVTKKRNAGMIQVSTLGVIQNLCTAFMCEPVFDTINKTVSFYSKRGEDKGVYFMSGLNLKKLQKKSTSYDYYTRIIPIGQDGLTIENVNNGKNYLENYQYSRKALTYIWKDESYTDAQALMEDAELKLNDLSKPEKSFSADVRDLAKQKPEYGILAYRLGDTVTIIDPDTGIREKQRIKKMVKYPQNPEKNTCEIANTVLTFEELQQKYQAAADIINYTVAGDGRYTGTINVSDILNFESGLADSSTVGGLNNSITDMQGEVAGLKLTLGELETNYLRADEADLKYATIERLTVVDEYVHDLEGDYASFKTVTAEELAVNTASINTLTGDLADYKTVVSSELLTAKGWMAEGSIGDAQISSVAANKLTAGTIDTAVVTIAGTDGRLQISDNTIQISDGSTVRVQIGKDASGDYSMSVWDSSGNLIWDALGATENTIQRAIIRDSMVAGDAAIQALKIDFQSFDTALTEQGVVISGTVVQVGSKTLNVVLSEQEQINTEYGETLSTHSSQIAANEQEILLKVSTQVYESDMAAMESSLQTVETSVGIMDGQITALVKDNTIIQDKYNDLESRTATLELSADNFAVELASTQKTVSDNYVTLQDYTDAAKASAISTAAVDATAKADNALTAAKADATSKANQALSDAKADATAKADAALSDAMDALDITNATVAVHAETISDHETRISATEDEISLKVSTKDFSSYQTTVTGQISAAKASAISTAASDATSKANKALSDAKTDATAKADAAKTSAVSTAASDATAKANQALIDANEYTTAEITTVNESLSITNQEINVMKGQIALKVEQTDIDTAVTNLQIGGRNLLSKAMMGTTTAISVNSLSGYGYTNGLVNTNLAGTTKVLGLRPSVNYVISFTAWCGANTQNMHVDLYPDTLPEKVFTLTTTPTRFVFNVYSTSADMPNGYLRFFKANGFVEDVYITDIMVEQGNKASQSWTPAPEDIDASISDVDAKFASYSTTSEMESAITVAKSEITSEVSETYSTKAELETVDGKVTTLEEWQSEASQKITKDGIIATVGNYYAYQSDLDTVENRVTEAESQILQQADEIELRVKKDGIVNAINLSTEEAKISAARITLAGATIADSFTATNLHITGNSTFDGILNGATGSFSGNIMAATLVVDNKISMNTAYGTTGKLFSTGESMDLPNVLWVDFDQIFRDVKFMSGYVDFYGEVYVERGISVGDTIGAEGIIRSEEAVSAGGMASIGVDGEGGYLNIASAFGHVWHIDSLLESLRFVSQTDDAVLMELGRYGGLMLNGYLELYYGWPYIDFHFNNSTEDYTSRIIEYKAGFLRVEAALYTLDYSGTYRRPVTSANGEENQVVMLSTSSSTKLSITGSWGDASTYTAKTITVSSSDIRLKESVKPSTVDALSLINKIKIRQFDWKDSGEHQNIGFIADELENLDEKLAVGGGYTEDGFMNVKSVDDFYLLGYLTKGVQELDQKYDLKVSELESKNEQLTVRIECRQDEQQILIEQLMDENAKLKKRVAQLEEQQAA